MAFATAGLATGATASDFTSFSAVAATGVSDTGAAFSATSGSPSTVTANSFDYYKFTGSGSFTV